jgi:hypothetical protein
MTVLRVQCYLPAGTGLLSAAMRFAIHAASPHTGLFTGLVKCLSSELSDRTSHAVVADVAPRDALRELEPELARPNEQRL